MPGTFRAQHYVLIGSFYLPALKSGREEDKGQQPQLSGIWMMLSVSESSIQLETHFVTFYTYCCPYAILFKKIHGNHAAKKRHARLSRGTQALPDYAFKNAFPQKIDFSSTLTWFIEKSAEEALTAKRLKDPGHIIPELDAARKAVSQVPGSCNEPYVDDARRFSSPPKMSRILPCGLSN